MKLAICFVIMKLQNASASFISCWKLSLEDFLFLEGPDGLSLQEIKQTPFVAFPFSGVLLFPLYLSCYLFFNIDAFFS